MKRFYAPAFLVSLLAVHTLSFGQTTGNINVVTSAVPMLRISPEARAGGMGDVGIATLPDANASFWNQAKIPFATQKSALALNYTPWLRDIGLTDVFIATAAGYHQIDENQAISASLRYFNLGTIQFTDFAGNDLQRFNPREYGFDVGYTRKLGSKLGMGIALRYIFSNLANGNTNGVVYKPGTAVAGDVSLYYNGLKTDGSGLTAGLVMSNLGSKISYTQDAVNKDYLPANLGMGVMYHKQLDETSKISFGMDINKLMVPTPPTDRTPENLQAYRNQSVISSWFKSFGDAPGGFAEEMREFQVSVGAEYNYNDQFFARAGYFYEDRTKGNRRFFSVGAGFKYNFAGFNFSYLVPSGQGINRNPLSNTTRFSVYFDLGNTN